MNTLILALILGNPLLTVMVKVDGKPIRMIVDTGAERTIFRSNIGRAGELVQLTGHGRFGYTVRECHVTIENESMTALCGGDLPLGAGDGVLGQDFLRQFSSVTVDYAKRTITLAR
jgi:hypothetical protein